MNKIIIHLENLLLLFLCLFFYFQSDYPIVLFIILFFVPDISIAAYFINKKIGKIVYNFFHSYSLPFLLLTINLIAEINLLLTAIALIWIAHIALDRTLGMGLKEEHFKKTHLQNLS
ncbi:DUF4260 domain-containing protein [Tetragenococcus halophilus]|uniref:DUF4260 family protein n=1 Tax=Tetragenococcus halophilus (strain DSM 20338 / JCM 20259 / NCIMB 9735 / NBRC 12172) TaxID=945021 RepID=A0AAN1VQV1_TETHN|nr:DUF4260 domain-containing protein [Tetragenococcus halophilus]QXN86110.1 DUF4260 domain-containing protein [Tetragenococcus halophilus]BAK94414.1 hypothetical protein TEH_10870 [Tetragenococcus halophilus NBRC 12172]